MPSFETPTAIDVWIDTAGGSVRIAASDRADTVVAVRPCDESRSSDVWAAEHTRVDFRDGKLSVTGPKRGLPRLLGGDTDVEIGLPTGSRLHVSVASASMRAEGEYGDVRFTGASGEVEIHGVTGKFKASSASGSISVHTMHGNASIATASGNVAIGDLDGNLRFKAASGSLTIDRLRGSIKSRTASGSVDVAVAVSGAISAGSSSGDVEVGVAEGTAARLDINTGAGHVTSELQPADGPRQGDETLLVQVRSGSGDIRIHRAAEPARETVTG